MPHLQRTFGIELESHKAPGITNEDVARAVQARIGESCVQEAYNHQLRRHWKTVPDASLGMYGVELVSPPLKGEEGLRLARLACEALQGIGNTVTRACGFHVHVGVGREAPLWFFKNLIKLYGAFEPVIDALMPPSRRRSENRFCRSVANVSHAAIDRCTSVQDLIYQYTGHTDRSLRRFFKVNLEALARHGTVEFRQHGGTLEPSKVATWITLCLKMVHTAMQPSFALNAAAQVNKARTNSRTWRIGEMMRRPEGVTRQQAIAAVGWPSVSLPLVASMCGLTYTTTRMGRNVYYYASATAVDAPQITLAGFANLIAANENERAWMQRRTDELSGVLRAA